MITILNYYLLLLFASAKQIGSVVFETLVFINVTMVYYDARFQAIKTEAQEI